jgi:arylsulfatase A-like enzyme
MNVTRLLLSLMSVMALLVLASACRLHAQPTTFFSDSFDRAADLNLDSTTTGMGGSLVTNGTLTASNIWLEPVDVANADDANARINASQQLQMGGLGNTVHLILNHNFATTLTAGTMSITLDLKSPGPGGAVPLDRYQAIGVGFSLAAGNVDGDRVLSHVADLVVGETSDGVIRINDEAPASRTALPAPSTTLDLNPSAAVFIPGTLRLDLTVSSTTAGSTVVYDVLFDQGSGFTTVAAGRTFQWSGTGEFHVGIEDRSVSSVLADNFNITGSNTAPAPSVQLSVSPDTIDPNNSAQAVTLNWSGLDLPPGGTYQISADRPVTYPGGGQSGSTAAGSGTVAATVNGNLGSTTFTCSVSNAVPQVVATQSARVTQIITPPANYPNILVIFFDDTGWGDFGCYGSAIQTPNIDALAAGGLRFRNFYNTARCSTSRCALMTGNYSQQVATNVTSSLPNLRTDNNITIAELLGSTGPFGATGYRTYKAGKWHLGTAVALRPRARGFDHNFGSGTYADGSNVNGSFDYWEESLYNIVSSNNEIAKRAYGPSQQFHYSDAIGDYSVDFLNHNFVTRNDGRPVFIYMPFNAPHWPVNGPATMANKYTDVGDPTPEDTDLVRYEDGWDVIREQTYQRQLALGVIKPDTVLSPKGQSQTPSGTGAQKSIDDWNTLTAAQRNDLARRQAVYASMVELDDQNIGKVINRLKELNQFDNTLIFVLADNGANYEGGEFGNSDDSNFTPWTTADLPAMGQPQSVFTAMGIATNKYARVHQGGAWANVSNTPYRLFKHFEHNGGIGSPLVVSWPAGIAAAVKGTWSDQRSHLIDIMATIADVTGAPRPTTFGGHPVLPLQGISLKPTFSGQPLPLRDLGFEHETNRAYYRGNWKLVTKNFAFSDGSSPADELELYDLSTDPTELQNRAVSEPVVLAHMVDAWNAWAKNVGLPNTNNYQMSAIVPPQTNPGPLFTDLLVDNFNRPDNAATDALDTGMSGSLVASLGAGNTYYEGRESNGIDAIAITNNGLRMSVNGGTCENGLKHNFIDPAIASWGGFSVQMRIDDINAFTPDSDCYAGFAVGLTQAQAAAGADIATPGSFRGNGVNKGVADCFIELDYFGHVKIWKHGVLTASVPTGKNSGTLSASFETTEFDAGSRVTVTVLLDGNPVDLDPTSDAQTQSFNWSHDNSNYIGLSTRVTGPVVSYVKLDNLVIRSEPLVVPSAYSLASEYALQAGMAGQNTAPYADPDGDQDSNLTEWLKGGQPGVSDAGRKLLMLGPTSQGEFRFNYFRLLAAAQYGVTYYFQYSTDLVSWYSFTPETTATVPDVPGYELVECRVPSAVVTGQPGLFVRLFETFDDATPLPAGMVTPDAPMRKPAATAPPAED